MYFASEYTVAMVTLYKRHLARCKHGKTPGSENRGVRSCGCPIWAQGVLQGRRIRRSTGCTSFKAAEELVKRWEEEGNTTARSSFHEIPFTIHRFLDDARARGITESSIKKYRNLLQRPKDEAPKNQRPRSITLEEFCAEKGFLSLADITINDLREFRERQLDSPISAAKKLERLKAFFKFGVESGWISASPAARIKPPSLKGTLATLPLTDEEIEALHSAIPRLRAEMDPRGDSANSRHLDRLAALLRVLEYSGLRISDAANLSTSDIVGGKLFLFAQEKTGEPVYVPLPEDVLQMLAALPLFMGKYYFRTGDGKIEAVAGHYRKSLRRLRQLIGKDDIHPHRWRDTFAVRLLEQGVPIEIVSRLLGHRSIEITQKHYSPWVRRLQKQAEEAVAKVWEAMGKKTAGVETPVKLRRVK